MSDENYIWEFRLGEAHFGDALPAGAMERRPDGAELPLRSVPAPEAPVPDDHRDAAAGEAPEQRRAVAPVVAVEGLQFGEVDRPAVTGREGEARCADPDGVRGGHGKRVHGREPQDQASCHVVIRSPMPSGEICGKTVDLLLGKNAARAVRP